MMARLKVGVSLGVLLCATLAFAQQPSDVPPEPSVTHPLVPGFERFFHQATSADQAAGGRLLLGELNCTACHPAGEAFAKTLSVKQAPVLDNVGARVRASHLRAFLAAPQKTKPGTTMPDLFAGLSDADRAERVESLVHFLASTGTMIDTGSQPKDVKAGETHFHRLGCVACHAPRKSPPALLEPRREEEDEEGNPKPVPPPTIIPLGDLAAKYTLNSLSRFLKEPLAVRTSGRMPSFNLNDKEAHEIASYFFKDHQVPANINYAWFEGDWEKLPDFATLQPKTTGQSAGFDLGIAERGNNYGVRFSGYIHLPEDGRYEFWLSSDDGSQLRIDGNLVVNNDGIHATEEKRDRKFFRKGTYPISLDYFQGGGEAVLGLDIAGPKLPRQPAAGLVTPTAELPKPAGGDGQPSFSIDPALVEKGQHLFTSVGCAACHTLRLNGHELKSTLPVKMLAQLNPEEDCLSDRVASPAPHYGLTEGQRQAIRQALSKPVEEPSPSDKVSQAMLALNCYACHARGERGGVELVRDAYFETAIKEMGDEGRLPPPLDGVGDKLNEGYLSRTLSNGAKDRLYMYARMPRFGDMAVKDLARQFAAVDLKTAAAIPQTSDAPGKLKSLGRLLMGDKGLSCAKCHPFNQHAEPGIQALKLNLMAGRLREDWFYRYLLDPQAYRPRTRMPGFFPEGRSTNKEILNGDPALQMQAMWAWLTDGEKAAVPSGLVRGAIVLNPTTEPIIYRNFIEGLSARGIAVGYPEQVHLAFDAEKFGLALLWQGQFIDASKHWVGRGPGFQGPLGDNILVLPNEVPFAVLTSANEAWPTKPAKEQGYQFKGYRLDRDRRPTLHYVGAGAEIHDFPKPVTSGMTSHFERTLTLNPHNGTLPPANLYYRAAVGQTIEASEGAFRIDGHLKVTVKTTGSRPVSVRTVGDKQELILPVEFNNGVAKIEQTYEW